jgi:hypothetical protein
MPLRTLDAMSPERRAEIRRDAAAFFAGAEMDAQARVEDAETQGRLSL